MKSMLITILLLSSIGLPAQTKLIPGKNVVEKKWLQNQDFQMAWYAFKDTARFEIGKTTTHIINNGNQITVITNVSIQQAKAPWIDSTIAGADDLRPVYHSSYNGRRDMVLNFGKIVTGHFNDKIKNSSVFISDTTNEGYFDSNLYPTLITWLPLQEGFQQDISIYDYTPGSTTGVIKARVQQVKKGIFNSKKSGKRNVWMVIVSDEIGGGENGVYTYHIDIADRRLWKQQINTGGRKMEMEFIEE